MKIEIKKVNTGLGYAFGVFVNGDYFHYGANPTEAYHLVQLIKEGLIDISIPFTQQPLITI